MHVCTCCIMNECMRALQQACTHTYLRFREEKNNHVLDNVSCLAMPCCVCVMKTTDERRVAFNLSAHMHTEVHVHVKNTDARSLGCAYINV